MFFFLKFALFFCSGFAFTTGIFSVFAQNPTITIGYFGIGIFLLIVAVWISLEEELFEIGNGIKCGDCFRASLGKGR